MKSNTNLFFLIKLLIKQPLLKFLKEVVFKAKIFKKYALQVSISKLLNKTKKLVLSKKLFYKLEAASLINSAISSG